MMSGERLVESAEEKFALASGDEVRFEADRSLRPDTVTEAFGYEAGMIVNVMHFVHVKHGSLDRPLRVLDLGCGSGIGLVACLSQINPGVQTELFGVDKDDYCVAQTGKNIDTALQRHRSDALAAVQLGDWFDDDLWTELGKRPWDVILFNPPYKTRGETVRPEFAQAPAGMVYADDAAGLEHYEQVLPRAVPLLGQAEGASMLVRLPAYYQIPGTPQDEKTFSVSRQARVDRLSQLIMQEAGAGFFTLIGSQGLFPVFAGGTSPNPCHALITRGRYLAPHLDPMTLEATLNDYPGVPRDVGEFVRMRQGRMPDLSLLRIT